MVSSKPGRWGRRLSSRRATSSASRATSRTCTALVPPTPSASSSWRIRTDVAGGSVAAASRHRHSDLLEADERRVDGVVVQLQDELPAGALPGLVGLPVVLVLTGRERQPAVA